MRQYYVYILASKTRVIYVGVTNNLERRVLQHKQKTHAGFTSKYNVNTLVYYEAFGDIHSAIRQEKKLKNMHRDSKIALIEAINPTWKDLAGDWDE
jgi:putative endonuclease